MTFGRCTLVKGILPVLVLSLFIIGTLHQFGPLDQGGEGLEGDAVASALSVPWPSFMPPQDEDSVVPEPQYSYPQMTGSRASRVDGTAKVIVIAVEFQDRNHSSWNTEQNLWNRTFSSSPDHNSMNNYYVEVSRSKFDITGEVGIWVKSAYNLSEYGEDSANGYIDAANGPIFRLVTEAVQLADPYVDFSEFDENGDGIVDHIVVVHAGQGQEAFGSTSDDIWSHHWAVLDADISQDGRQALLADGVQVYRYSMVSEHSPLGTWAHEFGHELGLPDLYDVDGSSYGIGKWGLMGAGSWNSGGKSPAHLCAWSKLQLGWISPVEVLGPLANTTISQVETGGAVLKLPIGDPATTNEYFLLENRQKVGYDQGLTSSGLLIWHVDDQQNSNADDIHRLVDLEEADEEQNGDAPVQKGDPWVDNPLGFNAYSIPSSSSYSGHPSGWTVKDIGPSQENMTITIDILADDVGVAFLLFTRYTGEDAPVDVEAHVFNFGIRKEEGIGLDIVVTYKTAVVDTIHEDIASLDPKRTKVIEFTFIPDMTGNYLITATTTLEGDQSPENDQVAEILHVSTIIFYDDVEGGENSWDHTSSLPPADIWQIVDDGEYPGATHSPHHSWFCGVTSVVGSTYVPFSEYYLERTIDVTLVKEGFLVFSHMYDLSFSVQNKTIPRSDTATVEIRTNRVATFTTLDTFTMTSGGWATKVYQITEHIKDPTVTEVTIRFKLESELLGLTKGWWLDDILIVGEWFDYDAIIILDESLMSSKPGDMRTLGATIWNIGTDADTYYLSAHAPPFWNVTLGAEVLSIGSLQHASLSITFLAADKALAGDEVDIVLTLVSKGNGQMKREAKVVVIVERVYGLEVETGPREVVPPGKRATFQVNITNEGNSPESVHLNVSGAGGNWSNLSAVLIDIPAYGTVSVDLSVDVPLKMKAGDRAEVNIYARAASGTEDTGIVRLEFGKVHGVELEAVFHDTDIVPGESVDLRYRITNLGNEKDEFELGFVLPPGWKVDSGTKAVLGPWESLVQTITVEVPETSPLGSFKVKALVRSGNDPGIEEEVDLKVKVVLPDPAVRSLKLSKTYVTGKQNITIIVVIENLGTGNATEIVVGFFDNGDNFHTMMVDNLGTGDSETLEFSYRFGNGHHDIAVVVTYDGAQADETNDEEHEDLKVKDEKGFIPGPGFVTTALASVLVALIMRGRVLRRKRMQL